MDKKIREVKSFLSSLYSFISKDGARFLTRNQVDERFEFCKTCEFFDSKKHACKICGCGCSEDTINIFNKLALPSESCPLHPPKWGPYVSKNKEGG